MLLLGLAWVGPGTVRCQADPLSTDATSAPDGNTTQSWDELYADLARRLQALKPRIKALESLGRPLNKNEREDLKAIVEELKRRVEELRRRKEEVPDDVLQESRDESLPLYTRLVALVEQTRDFAAPEEPKNAPLPSTTSPSVSLRSESRLRPRGSRRPDTL